MGNKINIRKGLDIRLEGEPDKVLINLEMPEVISINPDDFFNIKPKVLVSQGDQVKAGTPIMFDKNNPEVMITSPVSGEIAEVIRGNKRKLMEIRILADKETSYLPFRSGSPEDFSKEEIKEILCKSGAWNFIRQRPFTNVAHPDKTPKALFISGFDTAPLAPDQEYAIHGQENEFAAGLAVLNKLMDGKVHLSVHEKKNTSPAFIQAKGVKVNTFSGPHPSGNVGVQIHHIDPINKGEYVWYTYPQDVVCIGRLFLTGKFDGHRVVGLTGSKVKKRKYVKTVIGAPLKNLLANNLEEGENRYISGNVLTGTSVGKDGFLRFYDTQVTVIPEGGNPQFMGWLSPGFNKFSLSKTFMTWMMSGKKFDLNTNINGEERAFVVTGEYEKVFPMDIYPVQLLKSVITKDIDKQEELGIYEVAPEDFALCEYVCTSKIESQEIIRKGLEDLYNDEIESAKAHH